MLSVAIITYNEEENIREALESVKWADEIVVVDSFSTDKTQEICREYTDKVYPVEWAGFSAQKNTAISLTTQSWILVLDADERVSEDLKSEIVRAMTGTAPADGYYIARKNFFANKWIRHGGWWPDYTLRLFKREKGTFEEREVHEAIKVSGKTGRLENPIIHYTYSGMDDFMKRMEKYSGLAAKELYKQKRKSSLFDLIFRPPATFIKMYLIRLGMLDGLYGIILACLYSVYTFKKYSKFRQLIKKDEGKI
ncbi:MAG: glycosyltransferase family 2 protein [Thermodesulfovibrionia bacterium]|nr:glycosyltransferase family 2 protein [Thermodesulfovibrionia bacterium]